MKLFNSSYCKDSDGNFSSTRLKTCWAAAAAILLSFAGGITSLFHTIDLTSVLTISGTLLAYSAGEKTYNSFLEKKYDTKLAKDSNKTETK